LSQSEHVPVGHVPVGHDAALPLAYTARLTPSLRSGLAGPKKLLMFVSLNTIVVAEHCQGPELVWKGRWYALDQDGKLCGVRRVRVGAMIFDLDGTLLDTIDDLADAMNAALVQRGYPTHPVQEYKYFIGEGVDVFARSALPPQARDEKTVVDLVRIYRVKYAENWARKTRPYPGILALLQGLNARKTPMAVLSNKRDAVTKQMIAHFLPEISFTEIRGACSEIPLKPDPTGALAIAKAFALEPRNVLFVGDTKTDMQTATAAGMCAVGVLWGFRTADELRASGAEHLIGCPDDIFALLKAMPGMQPDSAHDPV